MNDERQPQAQRFGHYRAIAALEGRGEAALWHAWDPYLGRFVLVASLAGMDADSVRAALADLDGAVRRWTGVASFAAADVLHFFPGSDSEDAWLVLQLPAGPPATTAAATIGSGPAPAPRRDAALFAALVLAGLAILGLPLLLYLLSGRSPAAAPPPVVAVPTATATACAPALPSPTATPEPTATAKPRPPARKAAAPAPPSLEVGAPIKPATPAAEMPVARWVPAEPERSGAVQPGTVTAMTRRMAGADTLVREWLLRHCHEVERAYQAAGRNFACGWMGVTIEGDLPELTVTFTQIDRNLPTGRDLYINRSVRLLCTEHCITLQDEATTAEVY